MPLTLKNFAYNAFFHLKTCSWYLLQASTLDGVLEFRNEHFWTVSFGRMVRLHTLLNSLINVKCTNCKVKITLFAFVKDN